MNKFTQYAKMALLAWGAISLGAVITLIGWVALEYSSSTVHSPPQSAQDAPPMLDKSYGDIQLAIREGLPSRPRLTLVKAGRTLVTAYELPANLEGSDWIYDAWVYPMGGDSYRIVLLGTDGEGHMSGGRILLFKLDGQMRLVQHLPVGDVQKLDSTGTKLFGMVHVFIPWIDRANPYLTAYVPTLVSIGDEIRVTPMLDTEAIKLFRTHYQLLIDKRLTGLSGVENAKRVEALKKASVDLQEALTTKRFPY